MLSIKCIAVQSKPPTGAYPSENKSYLHSQKQTNQQKLWTQWLMLKDIMDRFLMKQKIIIWSRSRLILKILTLKVCPSVYVCRYLSKSFEGLGYIVILFHYVAGIWGRPNSSTSTPSCLQKAEFSYQFAKIIFCNSGCYSTKQRTCN